MTPTIDEDAFAVLLDRTGLQLSPEQRRTLYGAYGHVERMAARLAGPRPRSAEPAVVFRADAA